MEMDFMGLNSKDSLVLVKEEVDEGCKDSGFAKSSGVPWSVSNKLSALPHFMSFRGAGQDEKMSRGIPDHLASAGVMTMAPDAFDANHKRQSGEVQNFHSLHLSPDPKMLPMSMSNPFLKSHFGGAVQNFAGLKQQFIGGVPVATSRTLPSGNFIAGTTEPWFTSKPSGAPTQLTIFYGGAVNVFDDITPEKAQAIMLLAGNGCLSANMAQLRLQPPPTKLAPGDAAFGNQAMITPSSSALSSPISVSSPPIGHPNCAPNNNDETKAPKSSGMPPTNPGSIVDTPKMATTVGPSVNGTAIIPSAVPQFRKASLARFLEKRKERVMSSCPYNLKKNPAEIANLESCTAAGFSATSVAGSTSVSTGKDSP